MDISKKPWPLTTVYGIRDRVDTNPDYQRPAVWSTSQKQLLVDTILRNFDIPKLYWRHTGRKPDTYEVVDGQQRLRAIWDFFAGDYKLPKDIDPIDGSSVAGLLASRTKRSERKLGELCDHNRPATPAFFQTQTAIQFFICQCFHLPGNLFVDVRFAAVCTDPRGNVGDKQNGFVALNGKHRCTACHSSVLTRYTGHSRTPFRSFREGGFVAPADYT